MNITRLTKPIIKLAAILIMTVLLLQRATGIVSLDPQTYYVSEVPVEFTWLLFALINIVTMAVCIAVLVGPSFIISHIHPAKSMRYEYLNRVTSLLSPKWNCS